jgi:undecaprenyl-diphosphatase
MAIPTYAPAARTWRRLAALAARPEARLLAGGATLAGGLWMVLSLADEVQEGETAHFDRAILLALRRPEDLATPIGPRWLQESARDITALGGFTVLTLISVLAVVLLLMYGRRLQALAFAVAVIAAQAAAEILKATIGRARPDLVVHHDLVYSASFPSGHSTMTPVVYLTLAVTLAAGIGRRRVRALLVGCAFALVLMVGVSRVYLGVHWPTDVLAGWAMGAAFALAASIAIHMAAPPKPARAPVPPDTAGAP